MQLSPPATAFTSPITPPSSMQQYDGGGGGGVVSTTTTTNYTGAMLNPLMSLLQSMTTTMTPELALAFGTAHVVQSMDRRVESMDRRLDTLCAEAQHGFQEVGSHLTRIETNLNSLAHDAQSSLADVNNKLQSLTNAQAKKDFEEDPLVIFLSDKDNAPCLRALLVIAKWDEFREQHRVNHIVLDGQHPLPYGPIYCNIDSSGHSLLCIQTLCEAMQLVTGMSMKQLEFTQDLILGGGRRSGLTDFAQLIGVDMASVDRRTASLAFAGKMAKFVLLRSVEFERAISVARQLGTKFPLPCPTTTTSSVPDGLLPRVNWIRKPQGKEKFKTGKIESHDSLSYPQYLFYPWIDAKTTQADVDQWCSIVDSQFQQQPYNLSYTAKVELLFADQWYAVSTSAKKRQTEAVVARVYKSRAAAKVEQSPSPNPSPSRKRKAEPSPSKKQSSPKKQRDIEDDDDDDEVEEFIVASGKVQPPPLLSTMEAFHELEELLKTDICSFGGGGGGGNVDFFEGHHDDLLGDDIFQQ